MTSSSPRRRVFALVIVLFILGMALGASGTYLALERRMRAPNYPGRPTRAQVVTQLTKALDLTPQQKTQLETIIDQAHVRFHALDVQVEPQYDAIRQDTRNQIRAILRSDQIKKFEALASHWDKERRKRLEH